MDKAPPPKKQPIEKGIASPGLLAYVATQKYADALSLYRQAAIFKRIGVTLDRSNLANWMVRCGELVQPLINLLTEKTREKPAVHIDETTLQVLNEPDKHPMVVFHYDPRRYAEVPQLLLDPTVNTLMIDGYGGYQPACHAYGVTRLGCWANHIKQWKSSTETQKSYCSHHQLKAHQMIYWRKVFDPKPEAKRSQGDAGFLSVQLTSPAIMPIPDLTIRLEGVCASNLDIIKEIIRWQECA